MAPIALSTFVFLYLTYFIPIQTILKLPGFKDNVITHLLAGLGAGFFAVCIGSPIDVVSLHATMRLNNSIGDTLCW